MSMHPEYYQPSFWHREIAKAIESRDARALVKLDGIGGRSVVIALTPDGKTLASGGDDKEIHIWQLATGERTHTLKGHRHEVDRVDPKASCRPAGLAVGNQ
jgi:WD40 repeat protein